MNIQVAVGKLAIWVIKPEIHLSVSKTRMCSLKIFLFYFSGIHPNHIKFSKTIIFRWKCEELSRLMCRELFPSPRSSWRIYGEKTRKQIIYNQSAYVKCDYAYAHQFKKSFFLEWEIRVVQHRNRPRPCTIPAMVSAVLNHQEWPERWTNPKELVSELWQKIKNHK